jgi:hypothetical protein
MTDQLVPRRVTSVLLEEGADDVTVTWGLEDPISAAEVEYFGYELYFYAPDGNGGKRFGVRFHEKTTAHIWDNTSSTQANYHRDSVITSGDSIVVHYRDADLGLTDVGTIAAFSHVNGVDTQVDIPVTILR